MRRWMYSAGLVCALTIGNATLAQNVEVGTLAIEDPYVFESAPGGMSAAGYLSITNTGNQPDRLVEVRGHYPGIGLHISAMKNEVVSMMPVASVEIAPGQTVTMEPGGMHVMFMGLKAPFKAGETVMATLVFESAVEVEVAFPVKPRDATGHSH